MIEIVGRLAILAVPAVIGALVARRRWWGDLESATTALNRFAVDVAFPMLIVSGITAVDGDLPRSASFWLAVPVVDAVGLVVVLTVGARWGRSHRGTAALVGLFPNSAYLGLPLVIGVFGEEVRAAASAWVALQVGIAVAVGPAVLRWSLRSSEAGPPGVDDRWWHDAVAVLRRPLALAPLVGLVARGVGGPVLDAVGDVSDPIGRSASPVALFVLGVYCVTHVGQARRALRPAVAHTAWRMVGVATIALAVATAAVVAEVWSPTMAATFVALFAMPAGITTFALALDVTGPGDVVEDPAGTGPSGVVAATIVVSSLVGLFTLAPTIAVVRAVLDAVG